MYKYSLDIYVIDDDQEDPTLQKNIYIGEIGLVTTPNGCSLLGGPEGTAIP
jgi:hypothetical protein